MGGMITNELYDCPGCGKVVWGRPCWHCAILARPPPEKRLAPEGLDRAHRISSVTVKSVWIVHGVWGTTSNSSLAHWWASIEAAESGVWYCAMFDGGHELRISKHGSDEEVTAAGKAVVHTRLMLAPKNVSVKFSGYPRRKNMGDVVDFMGAYDGEYNRNQNNCQTFATALFRSLVPF